MGPEPAEGHDQDHGWNHVGGGEHLELEHAKAGCQHDEAATGLEVCNHFGAGQGDNHAGHIIEGGKDDELGQGDGGNHVAQLAGKDGCGEKVEDGFCDEDGGVTGHPRVQTAIDARTTRAKEDDNG